MNNFGICNICGEKAALDRCEKHYVCDDCGTRENLCNYCEGVLCRVCHGKRVNERIKNFKGSTDFTQEIICPYCGYEPSDSWEMESGEYDCEDCEKSYEVERNIEVTYTTSKINETRIKNPDDKQ